MKFISSFVHYSDCQLLQQSVKWTSNNINKGSVTHTSTTTMSCNIISLAAALWLFEDERSNRVNYDVCVWVCTVSVHCECVCVSVGRRLWTSSLQSPHKSVINIITFVYINRSCNERDVAPSQVPTLLPANTLLLDARGWLFAVWLQTLHCHHGQPSQSHAVRHSVNCIVPNNTNTQDNIYSAFIMIVIVIVHPVHLWFRTEPSSHQASNLSL